LHLQRLEVNQGLFGNYLQKNNQPVFCPEEMTIGKVKKIKTYSALQEKYDLSAMICHFGDAYGGRFVLYYSFPLFSGTTLN